MQKVLIDPSAASGVGVFPLSCFGRTARRWLMCRKPLGDPTFGQAGDLEAAVDAFERWYFVEHRRVPVACFTLTGDAEVGAHQLRFDRLASDQIAEAPALVDPGRRHDAEHNQEPVMSTVHIGTNADPHTEQHSGFFRLKAVGGSSPGRRGDVKGEAEAASPALPVVSAPPGNGGHLVECSGTK
jgi:hypothetical protein